MSIKSDIGPFSIIPEWVIDAEVSDRAVRLYVLLGRYADSKGASHPSRTTLAKRLRCSVDSLDRAAKELIEANALKVRQRKVTGTKRLLTNVYVIRQVAARVRPGSREAAVLGSRTGAAENDNQLNENTLRVVSSDTPRQVASLVGEYVQASQASGHKPTSRERERAGAELKRLLTKENRPYEIVVVVARIMGQEGKPAGVADWVLGDVERAAAR